MTNEQIAAVKQARTELEAIHDMLVNIPDLPVEGEIAEAADHVWQAVCQLESLVGSPGL